MTIPHAAVLTLLACTSMSASAIRREDVLECGLPEGGKFILVAKYDWEPLARIIPADVAERLNQEPFSVYFQPKRSLRKLAIESMSVAHKSLAEYAMSAQICQRFGEKNGVPYAGTSYFLPAKSTKFVGTRFDRKLVLSDVPQRNPEHIRLAMKDMHAYPAVGAISVINGHLVSERAVMDVKGAVVSVFRSESHDNGESWRDPTITSRAEIFEIGKRIEQQTFIARPIRINGKKVKPDFPSAK